jgi:hypothetical protein
VQQTQAIFFAFKVITGTKSTFTHLCELGGGINLSFQGKNLYRVLMRKPKETDHLEDLGVDGNETSCSVTHRIFLD